MSPTRFLAIHSILIDLISCVCIDAARFRILNSVFRGHITSNVSHLSAALKIIMHSNYVHTRDHPQRTHQPMNLDLDEITAAELAAAPPHDPEFGTGFVFHDFAVGDIVYVWHMHSWWHGKVAYKSQLSETITVRLTSTGGQRVAGIDPKLIKPAK